MKLLSLLPAFQLSFRTALAAGLAVAVAEAMDLRHPLYAMIAAVLVTDLQPTQTRKLGLARLLGTLLGAGLGASLGSLGLYGPLVVGVSIFAAMILCHVIHLKDAAKVAGYVSAIVLLDHRGEAWVYAFYRTVETVLGIVFSVLMSLVPLLIRIDEAKLHDQEPHKGD